MATIRLEADEIRCQMAEIRSELHQDMRGVVNVAATVTDWRSYIRGRPWLAIGVAFTSGFLLVPRRARDSRLVLQPLALGMEDSQAPVKSENPSRSTLFRSLLGVIGPIAVRAGQSYLMNYVENLLANQQQFGPRPEAASWPSSPGTTARTEERGFATRG